MHPNSNWCALIPSVWIWFMNPKKLLNASQNSKLNHSNFPKAQKSSFKLQGILGIKNNYVNHNSITMLYHHAYFLN
jgi:hypothetical protein